MAQVIGALKSFYWVTMRSAVYARVIRWASLFGLLLSLTVAAAVLLFSTFRPDDEGYVLLSLRNFSVYGGLYDRVYTQYGPAFFLIDEAIRSALRMGWTSESARVLALLNWVGTAICCGLIVYNRTRSKLLGALSLTLTFTYLIYDVWEPGHPGAMLALLVSFVTLIGSTWDIAERPAAAAAVGAIGAVVALSKMNVGAFLLIAGVFWILMHSTYGSRYVRFALYASLVVLPWVLMGSLTALASMLMGRPAEQASSIVVQFALIFDLVAIGIFAAMESTPRTVVPTNALTALIVGSLVISIIVLILILSRGTSLSGFVTGVFIDPLKHPGVIFHGVTFGWLSFAAALVALALAVGFYLRPYSKLVRYGIILGRVFGTVALIDLSLMPSYMAPVGLVYGLTIVALYAIPLSYDDAAIREARFRQWIAILLVLQSLQAYPVAGSQMCWGTYLLVPLAVIAFKEAWDAESSELTASMPLAMRHALGVCLIAIIAARTLVGGVQKFKDGEWLGLPGAEHLSLPIKTVLTFRTLSENVRAHADQLFSIPGAFSFNLWTGVATPTLANATLWHTLLNSGAQAEIIARLKDDPKAVVIRHGALALSGPLGTYIERNFEPAFGVDEYEFLVHRKRKIAALSTASIRPDPGDPNYSLLSITLGVLNTPISAIEIWQTGLSRGVFHAWLGDIVPGLPEVPPGRRLLARLDETTGNLWLTPLNEDGAPSGETGSSTWPIPTQSKITQLEGHFDARLPQTEDVFVVVRSTERPIASVSVRRN